MVQVIAGDRGSGKTKRLLSIANETAEKTNGHIVWISINSEGIFELDSSIRHVNVSSFPISSVDSLVGFIYGMLSQDYDIESIFIDNLSVILNDDTDAVTDFLKSAKKISEKAEVNFVFGVKNMKCELENVEAEYLAV